MNNKIEKMWYEMYFTYLTINNVKLSEEEFQNYILSKIKGDDKIEKLVKK